MSGKRAFKQLVGLLNGGGRVDNKAAVGDYEGHQKQHPGLPLCLRTTLASGIGSSGHQATKLPCLVCAKLFDNAQQLIRHSPIHTFEGQADDIYCCICGLAFDSVVSLNLHQSPLIPVVTECQLCSEELSVEEKVAHVCRKRRPSPTSQQGPPPRTHLSCPLEGCNVQSGFEDKHQLGLHLRLVHGCRSNDQVLQLQKKMRVKGEREGEEEADFDEDIKHKCPLCRQAFFQDDGSGGGGEGSIERHLALHCESVGPLQRQSAKIIIETAKVNGLDPDLVLKQELESSLLHVLQMLDELGRSAEAEAAAASVGFLTLVMHRTRSRKFQKLMVDSIGRKHRPNLMGDSDVIVPSCDVTANFALFKDNFAILFDIWSISFEYSLQYESCPDGFPLKSLSQLLSLAVENDNPLLEDMGFSESETLRRALDDNDVIINSGAGGCRPPYHKLLNDLILEIRQRCGSE